MFKAVVQIRYRGQRNKKPTVLFNVSKNCSETTEVFNDPKVTPNSDCQGIRNGIDITSVLPPNSDNELLAYKPPRRPKVYFYQIQFIYHVFSRHIPSTLKMLKEAVSTDPRIDQSGKEFVRNARSSWVCWDHFRFMVDVNTGKPLRDLDVRTLEMFLLLNGAANANELPQNLKLFTQDWISMVLNRQLISRRTTVLLFQNQFELVPALL